MYDTEITDLLKRQNNKITDSQLSKIRNCQIEAYNLKYLGGPLYQMNSKWGGSWEFEYM